MRGRLLFGTVDSWLIWNLGPQGTCHRRHQREPHDAVRHPRASLGPGIARPVRHSRADNARGSPSASSFGVTDYPEHSGGNPHLRCCGRPAIRALRAMLLRGETGQEHLRHGRIHAPSIPETPRHVEERACHDNRGICSGILEHAEYALEGSVFMAGALVQWLVDELGILPGAGGIPAARRGVPDTGGVYIVPAFTGLGAPYWKPEARGAIYGLTRPERIAPISYVRLSRRSPTRYMTWRAPCRPTPDSNQAAQRRWWRLGKRLSHAIPKRHTANTKSSAREHRVHGARRGISGRPHERLLERGRRATCLTRDGQRLCPAMKPAYAEELLAGWREAIGRTC